MRIKDEYVKTGYFWLPGKDLNKIPGVLTIKDGGVIELEIVGHFDGSNESLYKEFDLARIIGLVEDDGLVTLDDCSYIQKNISFGGISKSKVGVNRVWSGFAYDANEAVTFNTLSFSVDCFDEWVGISGIKFDTDLDNKTTAITYKPPEDIVYSLENGMQLEIYFRYTLSSFSTTTEAKITQSAYFRLKSEELRPFSDFESVAYKLTSFMCFAIDATVSIKNLIATSSKIQRDGNDGCKYPSPIMIYYMSATFNEKAPNKNMHQITAVP